MKIKPNDCIYYIPGRKASSFIQTEANLKALRYALVTHTTKDRVFGTTPRGEAVWASRDQILNK